jgi:hypothetical protein
MDIEQTTIARFIADRTGLSEERVEKIVTLGEPWPFVRAFSAVLQLSKADAEQSGTALEAALAVNAELFSLGNETFKAEALDRHIERTVDLTGEEEITVRAVQTALHDCFRTMIEQVERVAKSRNA